MNYDDHGNHLKRTDKSFSDRRDDEHHKYDSVMERLIKMVSQLPIDAMHLVKGVTEKQIKMWFSLPHFLSTADKNEINRIINELQKYQPDEFGRSIRDLSNIGYLKASEFRTFALYTGPISLKGVLSEAHYRNFLKFSCALRIMTHPQFQSEGFLNFAEVLSKDFVEEFIELYPGECVFNIHLFTHLVDDCRLHGTCDTFACYKYETFLYRLKLMIHNPKVPLIQIYNRLHEIIESEPIETLKKSKSPNLFSKKSGDGFQRLNHDQFSLDNTNKNKFVQLKNGSIFKCEKFFDQRNEIKISGFVAHNKQPFFIEPFDSTFLDMYKVNCTSFSTNLVTINFDDIKQKLFGFKRDNMYEFLPLSNF
jgi:hypothetical protein